MKPFAAFTLLLTMAGGAQAVTTYSLAGDFSNAANANGVWSFTQGSSTLLHFGPVGSNTLNDAVSNGFWGVGNNLDTAVPFVAKTSKNGAAAAGYSNADFLAGQVILHSSNTADTATSLFVNWTAPGAGTIQYSATAWYAHSPVNRGNDILVALNGNSLAGPFAISNTSSETNRVSIGGATSYNVAAGDVLSFEIRKQLGQPYGSITGLDETVLFTATPVPEPSAYGLMLAGLAGLAGVSSAARRRASTAAR
jgi:hypothetical protein